MEGLTQFLMLFLVVGFAAGAGAVWLVLQGRTNSAYARARAELESSHAGVAERLRGREEQVQTLQSTLDQGVTAMEALKAEVANLTSLQTATAAEKAALAARLEERDQRLTALESEFSSTKAALIAQAERAAAPPPPPASAAPIDEAALQTLARPIEEQLQGLRVRLEHMEAEQSRSAAGKAELCAHNAELKERLNGVTRGLCELRGALARSLDLCSLAVATAETAAEPAPVQAAEESGEPVELSA
jgi:DNA repair exonuclease SbcCD ATPase subunit